MSLDKKEVLKLANLAKLQLDSDEVEQYQHQLEEVLDYVDQLKDLNLATIEPSLSGVKAGEHQLRSDQVGVSQPKVIDQAAELNDGLMVSPAVFKK